MMRRLLLALDTSFGPVSAALLTADGEVIGHHSADNAAGQQAEMLPPLVASLFREYSASFEELARVVVSTGPGAFTGVRVGIAFAKGLQIATGAETVGISSLDCLAEQARLQYPGSRIAVMVDARRSEIYVAACDEYGKHLVPPSLLAVSEVAAVLSAHMDKGLLCFGSGRHLVSLRSASSPDPDISAIDAVVLGRMGAMLAPAAYPLVPAYLRAPDARLPS